MQLKLNPSVKPWATRALKAFCEGRDFGRKSKPQTLASELNLPNAVQKQRSQADDWRCNRHRKYVRQTSLHMGPVLPSRPFLLQRHAGGPYQGGEKHKEDSVMQVCFTSTSIAASRFHSLGETTRLAGRRCRQRSQALPWPHQSLHGKSRIPKLASPKTLQLLDLKPSSGQP